VPGALELTDVTRQRIRELQELSDRAEDGDEDAKRELRRAVRESAPEVIARCSDTARTYRRMLAETASGGDPLIKEATVEQAALIASDLAGENPSALEVLLAERIASLWVFVELLEALTSAYFYRGNNAKRPPVSYLLQMIRVQESVNRRYLASITTLARVRRLQANTPAVHLTQINVR